MNCELCNHDEPICGVESPHTLVCTRPLGHEGDHTSCGFEEGNHPVERWPATVPGRRAQVVAEWQG